MVDLNKYIVDGKVKRGKITLDVKRGRLSQKDILELDNYEAIRNSYFGQNYQYQRDKKEWSEKYLDELSLYSVCEVFNKEYLLYLHEVACYIAKKSNHNIVKKFMGGIIIILLIATIIIYRWLR
jgi:hypothetical protein